ncbi:protein of unknown function [Pararobbsia alpina]|uniref:tail fiber domain-containing protein n=1 Tax=Pararobbsia alpina TaxID=621374 RepID=UPI0039A5CBE8
MIRNPRQLHLMRLGLPAVPTNGGGGGNTTSNTVSTPWTGQQPYLTSVFNGAANTYNGMSANPSSSVAGFTPMQQQAMGDTQNVANGTNFGNAATLNNSASSYTNNLVNGAYLNSNPANSTLQSIASGSQLNPNSNPYMQGMANAANTNIINAYQTATAPQTSSQMEAAGRYGSGAAANAQNMNQQGLATQLANAQNNLYGSMYQTNEGNQLNAAGQLSNNYNTAAQQQLQGSYNAPNIVNSVNSGISNLYNMGGNQQALAQSQINAPWQLLNNYSNLIQGQYGGNTSTSTPYYTNNAAGALGGATMGATLGSSLSNGSSYGGAAGALLGGLAAYSDRRLKEDIEITDERLANGLPVYRYRYVWDAPHARRFGVMADDVRRVHPGAVTTDAIGFDMVDYAAIGGAHVLLR